MAEKKSPVQDVRNVALEEKLDKLIELITLQNKAWQKCLTLLTEMNTLLFEKHKSQELLLEQFPAVMGPSGVAGPQPPDRETAPTVGGSHQPQPFNDYSDRTPYGTELEEEARPTVQSFPVPPDARPPQPAEVSAQQTYRAAAGREQVVEESAGPDARRPPPSTKAEILEHRELDDVGDL